MADFKELQSNPSSRRTFLTRMAGAGLGAAALSLLTPTAQASGKHLLDVVNVPDNEKMPGIPGRTKDEQVLNYALTLETLEADLYRQALNLAAGKDITTPLPDDTSSYTMAIGIGGMIDPYPHTYSQLGFTYLRQFAAVEAAHRDFLRAAIQAGGGTPVGPNPGGYHAPFGNTLESILQLILQVEETGVRAYLGAAGAINNFKTTQIAASIYSTEARHSAAIKMILAMAPDPTKQRGDSQVTPRQMYEYDFEFFQTPEQIIAAVTPFFA